MASCIQLKSLKGPLKEMNWGAPSLMTNAPDDESRGDEYEYEEEYYFVCLPNVNGIRE